MSEQEELKLACLHQAGGNLDHAKALFDWVSGSVRATPDSEAAEVSAPKQDKPQQPFNYQHPSKYGTDVPRRCYLEELTPEERAIRDLVDTVERLGAHPLLTATVIQLMKAGEDLADWVDIGLRDKAIAALSPGSDLGLLDENPAAGDTEVRNQAEGEAGEPKMFWYASGNEEDFAIGPCGTREEAIEQALDDEVGISTDLKRQVIFVMQAYQEPLKLSRMISVDAILDRAMDGLLGDAAGDEGEPDQLVDHIKQEQWKALEAKLRETMDAWQAEGDIVVTPYVFTRSTKPEAVCYLCVGEEQVVARKWEDAPFEGVMDAKHVADDDTYALINGEWFGPLPEGAHAPIGAAEITADAERISVVTDQDRVEPTTPPSPDPDLLLENQPGVSSQASSGEGETLPSMDDIIDPDFTGGLLTEEYLERLHKGTLGAVDEFLSSIMKRGGTWHDGGNNPAPNWFVDIYVPAASTSLGDKPQHLEGQPSNAYIWGGWECAYVRTKPMQLDGPLTSALRLDEPVETPTEPAAYSPVNNADEPVTKPEADVFYHGLQAEAESKKEPVSKLFGAGGFFGKREVVS